MVTRESVAPGRAARQSPTPTPLPGEGDATGRVRSGQRTLALGVAALWLAGLVPAIAAGPAEVRVFAAATLLAWAATAARRSFEPAILVAVMLACSVGLLLTTHGTESASPIAAVWFDATALVAGFGMASRRRALAWVAAVGVASLAAWGWILAVDPVIGGWRSAVAWSVASVGIGIAAAAASGVGRMAGRRLDAMTVSAEAAVTREELASLAQVEHFRASRLLHDTVINTLSAINRGVPEPYWPQLRERCRQDLGLVESAAEAVMARDPVAAAGARAAALGLDLTIRGPVTATGVTEEVLEAASGAIGEALLNVVKHSGVTEAELEIHALPDAVRLRLLDRGSGLSEPLSEEGGVRQSILRRCERAGIAASVAPLPGGGTVVTLHLPKQMSELAHGAQVFTTDRRLMMALGIGALLVETGVRSALTVGLAPALGAVLAWLLLAAVLGLAAWSSWDRFRPPPLPSLLVSLVSLPVLLLLPQQTGPLAWMWWGTVAAVAVFVMLALTYASGWWMVVAYLSQIAGRYLADPEGSMSLLTPGVITIAIGALACRWIRQRLLTMVGRYDAAARKRDAARQRRLLTYVAQQEELVLLKRASDAACAPLADIAEGLVEPDDADLRREAGDLARSLRDVSRAGPEAGEVGRGVLRLLERARARGTRVALTIDVQRQPPAQVRDALTRYLDGIASDGWHGEDLTLRLFSRVDGGTMTVLSDGQVIDERERSDLLTAGVGVEHHGEEGWLELSWCAGADGAPPLPGDDNGEPTVAGNG